jgi:hypothetical protein
VVTHSEGAKNEGLEGVISKPGDLLGSPGLACRVHTLDEEFRMVLVNTP